MNGKICKFGDSFYPMKKYFFLLIVFLLLSNANLYSQENELIQILLLSGSNNHEWQQTTPLLANLFLKSGKFSVKITERPDTLSNTDFSETDVVVSNWNSWPENDLRWPAETESALLQFIENGGGFVTFHASSSVFYKWPEFQKITTSAWIMDSTSHGKPSETNIAITNKKHPVTKGLNNFVIFDELWLNAAKNPKFEVLGFASNKEITETGVKPQPAIMVAGYGKGRIFHTILGHDTTAIQNPGFETLMINGAEWSAIGNVTQ
jgi:type 1 glutamine amidotransferase